MDVSHITLLIVNLNIKKELAITNINNYKLDKEFVNVTNVKRIYNDRVLPISIDTPLYGEKLLIEQSIHPLFQAYNILEGIIYKGENILNKLLCPWQSKTIRKKNDSLYKDISHCEDYPNCNGCSKIIRSLFKIDFLSAPAGLKAFVRKNKEDKYLILINCYDIDDKIRNIEIFDLKEVQNLEYYNKPFISFKDTTSSITDGFSRSYDNITISFSSGKLIKYKAKQNLPILKLLTKKIGKLARDILIGAFDVETYYDHKTNLSYVYALGFKILGSDKFLFYIKKGQTSEDLIIECIEKMLIPKYHNYKFYVHNLNGYDSVFLLKALINYNLKHNKFKIDCILKDNRIIKLKVSLQNNKKLISISFVDSLMLLNGSLDKLGKDFGCNNTKGHFPYKFISKNNLFFVGRTPDLYFFENITNVEYNSILSEEWDVKEETLKYLAKDIDLLLEIMDKFSLYIYNKYGVNITNCLTISKLAITIYLTHYLNEKKIKKLNEKEYYYTTLDVVDLKNNTISYPLVPQKINNIITDSSIPLITNISTHGFIRLGYYGGICEVYKPHGKNLLYIDATSMYPFVAQNPMPGNNLEYIEISDFILNKSKGLELDKLFGFFYCHVKTNGGYIGLLPLHLNSSLILPNGEFYGV